VAEFQLAADGFALDGQIFSQSPGQAIQVRATTPVAFLRLAD
jgi:hypothetical protein